MRNKGCSASLNIAREKQTWNQFHLGYLKNTGTDNADNAAQTTRTRTRTTQPRTRGHGQRRYIKKRKMKGGGGELE